MKNLFKNLIPYKGAAVLVLLLLIGQAFCDMNLPQYTQKMIDGGIQNRGIEHILPVEMTYTEYKALEASLKGEEKTELREAYRMAEISLTDGKHEQFKKTVCRDESLSEDELDALDAELIYAVISRYQAKNGFDSDSEEARTIESAREEAKEKKALGETSSSINETLMATGIAYAAQCDEEAGVDVEAIQNRYMWKCGGMMFLMSALMLICAILTSFLAARIGARIGRDLRLKLFKNVMSFSTFEMDRFHTSSLITRATNDIQQVQMTCTMLLRMMLYAPCICIWGIVMVYRTHAHMNFIIATGVCLILILMGGVLYVAMPKFKIMQTLVDGLNSVSREILTGVQVIRAFGREKTEEQRFEDANHKLYRNQLFTSRVMTLLSPIMMVVMYGLTTWIMWVGSHRVDAGTIQVGALTAFISYAMMIVTSFLMIAGIFIFIPRAGVAADRIAEVIETSISITEGKAAREVAEDAEGVIRFNHVSFMYPDAEENVLTDIDFEAKPGETTAIIGSTGCGKTTLIDLIPRFYDVTDGAITIDGVDVRKLTLKSLRNIIGYVPQKGMLFQGTIESNIRFGRTEATDDEVRMAAEVAQADEFIEEKEDKYNSPIAQGGSNVSGGQKQRLSIARALAKKPKILIFDDSFSALDMKTDAELRKALAEEAREATTIVVAQRVGTILHAEQILVLDEGRIVGKGTHKELMRSCRVYREIAESQLSPEELESTTGMEEV